MNYPMNIHKLHSGTLASYLHFTFPKYQQLLYPDFDENQYVAYGVTDGFYPIGLGIASIKNKQAQLLSLYIQDDYRNQKIGTKLYQAIEKDLQDKGAISISLEYMKERKTTPYLEKILRSQAFENPALNMTFFYFEYESLMKPRWMRELCVPKKYEVFSLYDMNEKDHKDYEKIISEPSFPHELKISKDFPLTPQTSFGLRTQTEFVGWMTTHFIQSDLLRYSCLFVKKEHLSKGASISLIAHTVREHYKVFKETKPRALFAVRADYKMMHYMMMRKLAPYSFKIEQGMVAKKAFSAAF